MKGGWFTLQLQMRVTVHYKSGGFYIMFLRSVYAFKKVGGSKNIAIPISSKHFLSSGQNKLLVVIFLEVVVVLYFLGRWGGLWRF